MLYEFIQINGVWTLHWGGRVGQEVGTPACKQREVATPIVTPQQDPVTRRRDEPILTLQA